MRSPEAARAIPELVAGGVLSPERAAPLLAAARGEIVTVRAELRALFGLAVTLATAGAGLFVKEYRDALGPTTVAALLTAATALALLVLFRREPRFDWGRNAAPDWTSDGLVLLAIGLAGADLAWIEIHFTPLGADWPLHLFAMSLLSGALAVRFDSIPAWSLALSTFAAWRGVALMPVAAFDTAFGSGAGRFRFELLLVAGVFFALGRFAERTGRKAHFEPATTFLALVAAASGLAAGLAESGTWPLWALALTALGGGAAAWAFRRRRRALFALGSLALYVALTRGLFALPFAELFGCFWFAFSTVGAIVLLVLVHRRFRDEEAS
jgi:hypothetical protein